MAFHKLTDEEKAERRAAREAAKEAATHEAPGFAVTTGGTAEAAYEEPPPTPPKPENPTVMLLVDHVFLPEDPTTAEWTTAKTRKYEGTTDGRRTRVECHPTLAAFLQDRKQAEIL
jgi:hypothetical protein